MARRTVTTGFTAGEVDPQLQARYDLKDYYQGAKQLRDWCLLVQGGIRRRWGSSYILDLGVAGRIEEFVFKDDQEYVFYFIDGDLDAYKVPAGTACTVTGTPLWTTANLWELDYTYAGDTTVVVHKDFKPQKVVRTGATTFTVSDYTFETTSAGIIRQPYFKFAADAVTLTPSNTTGSVTVTASSGIFDSSSNWVDKIIRIKEKQLTITGYTDTTHVTATCNETLVDTNATDDWDEQTFSAHRGWPRSVCFHEDRLMFGGSKERPTAPFGSKTGAYYNYDVGSGQATDSIQKNIAFDRVTEIKYMVSHRHLLLFTNGGEVFCPSPGEVALTPDNTSFKRQSTYGTATVKPKVLDDAALFVQKNGKVVRETIYDYLQASYASNAVSLRSTHVLSTPTQLATLLGGEDGPEQYAFFLNTDGTIAVYHSVRTEKLRGWTLWATDGYYKSICTTSQHLYAAVERTIDGSSVYYLEKFDPNLTLDCAKTVTLGAASTTVATLSHLNGQVADAVQGNLHFGEATISAGSGTWDEEMAIGDVSVGLNFIPILETLPPVTDTERGTSAHQMRRIASASVKLKSSMTVEVAGQMLQLRQATDDFSVDPEEKADVYNFNLRGYSREPTVTLRAPTPLPLTVLGMVLEGDL